MTKTAKQGILRDLARWVERRDNAMDRIKSLQEEIEQEQVYVNKSRVVVEEAQEVIAEYARVWGLTEEMAKEAQGKE